MKKGFTLLELLVVIAIIGTLAGLALFSFESSESQARDTERRSDLKQYQTQLERYANVHDGFYPRRATLQNVSAGLCTNLGISPCVLDPRNGQSVCEGGNCGYFIITSGGSCAAGQPCATGYVLYARLENQPSIWTVCSNGQVGTISSTTAMSATCPL